MTVDLTMYNQQIIEYTSDEAISLTPEYPIEIAINREKFIKMLDKGDDTYNIIIGKYTVNGSNSVDRVLFDSVTSATKIIIAGLKDN